MELNQISQFFVKNIELFSNKFLKQEDIFIFIHIVEPINISTKSSSYLPFISCWQTLKAVFIIM